jgi:hypothetical protein
MRKALACLPQVGHKHQPACRQAGEVTLVPVRLRLWVQRVVFRQPFFLIYFFREAFFNQYKRFARPQRLGPTFEIYQNREGFKNLY